MKQFFRFFSLGLFVASLTIFIFYNYFDSPEVNPDDFKTEELIDLVEDDGYRVITEEEYITYTVNEDEEDLNIDKSEDKQEKDENAEEKDENAEDNDDPVKYTLEIKPNMMPHEVILLLEEKKIIKDAEKFADFMDKNDYSPYIQQGEFELTSDMSEEEIAKTITKN